MEITNQTNEMDDLTWEELQELKEFELEFAEEERVADCVKRGVDPYWY